MRILLITDYATPTGGAELVMLRLRSGLRHRGHDARLLASTARPLGQVSQADYHCFGMMSPLRGLTQVWNPSAYWKLRSVLAEFRPEVVHVRLFLSQLSPAILPLLRNTPAIYHAAWYRAICPLGTKLLPDGSVCNQSAGLACVKNRCIPAFAWPTVTAQRSLQRRSWSSFNWVVANSHATERSLTSEGIAVDQVIWNGVEIRPPAPPLGSIPTIVFAGRLVREKGTANLLEAFSQVREHVPEARLLIAGDGPERVSLEALATRLNLQKNVRMLGMLTRDEMEKEFAHAWAQVVPSLWQEPFGLVAAEALMRGTPAVVSDSGGLTEIVESGKTGLHCPAGDIMALSAALRQLCSNPVQCRTMGEAAREFALSHLDNNIFVDRFIERYDALIRPGGR